MSNIVTDPFPKVNTSCVSVMWNAKIVQCSKNVYTNSAEWAIAGMRIDAECKKSLKFTNSLCAALRLSIQFGAFFENVAQRNSHERQRQLNTEHGVEKIKCYAISDWIIQFLSYKSFQKFYEEKNVQIK